MSMSMSTTVNTTTTTANIGSNAGNTTIGLLVGYGDDPPRPPPRGRRRAQSVYNQPNNGNSTHRRSLADMQVSFSDRWGSTKNLFILRTYPQNPFQEDCRVLVLRSGVEWSRAARLVLYSVSMTFLFLDWEEGWCDFVFEGFSIESFCSVCSVCELGFQSEIKSSM